VDELLLDIVVIVILVVINGVLAVAEIAVVTARRPSCSRAKGHSREGR